MKREAFWRFSIFLAVDCGKLIKFFVKRIEGRGLDN